MQQIESELSQFKALKAHFQKENPSYRELDTYGFALSDKTEILFTGLTHGNELIGIQIINKMLEQLKGKNSALNFAFLLNNVEAYRKNVRFLESDLNRSFCRTELKTLEHKRAREVENVMKLLKPRLVIDLHQTSEPALGVFMMVPEIPEMIRLARNLTDRCAIVTYSATEGFSTQGKTLGEFAETIGVIEVVFELGQKGFNDERAKEYCDLLLKTDLEKVFAKTPNQVEYLHIIDDKVPVIPGFKLIDGIHSLSEVKKGQILAQDNESKTYVCEQDAFAIFPRYSNITEADTELSLLAVKKWV